MKVFCGTCLEEMKLITELEVATLMGNEFRQFFYCKNCDSAVFIVTEPEKISKV